MGRRAVVTGLCWTPHLVAPGRVPPRPRRSTIARRRGRRPARPQRRRQDHRAARPGRPAAARRRVASPWRRGAWTTRAAGVRRPPERRRSAWSSRTTCSSRTSPRWTTSRSGRAAAGAGRAEARRRGRDAGWTGSASPTSPPASPGSSPAGRPNGSRSPARSPSTRALLLLDEPLAALDARTRLDTRGELHRHLADHPGATLLVTHDPLDALVLADRLVIIEDGRVVQEGDAATSRRAGRAPTTSPGWSGSTCSPGWPGDRQVDLPGGGAVPAGRGGSG